MLLRYFITYAFCFVSLLSHADDTTLSTRVDHYTIHHTVFSSTALQPEIAKRYGLVRGKNYVLLNVALVPKDRVFGGVPARVSGSATNLMQQRKELEFVTIDEPNATYYIAPLRITEEEFFHFLLEVTPQTPIADQAKTYTIKFTKKMYVNE